MTTPDIRGLIAKWREAAKDAGLLAAQYDRNGDTAGNSHAFRKERRIWTTCADELEALLSEAAPQDDMCAEHRSQGGDPDCDDCFHRNYEEIGRELVAAIKQQMPDYSYADSPVEVVGDLLSQIDDLKGEAAPPAQSGEEGHEPGCPAIADDESDMVLYDYGECCCDRKAPPLPPTETE